MIGREPRFETFAGDDPFEFVIGRHLNRGPLSESQRAMAAARAANLQLGDNQYSQGLPIGRASELLNVSSRSIARARFVLRLGTPDLIAAVDSGSLKLWAACNECQRLCKQAFRNGNAPATVTAITQEAGSTAQAETASGEIPGGETEGSTSSTISIPQATESDVPSIAENGAETTAELVEAAEATIAPTTWVWSEHIPCAAVTAITGNSSMVSIVAIRLAATVAVGRQFPDYEWVHRGEVVWVSNQSKRTLFGALDLACGTERPMPIEVLEPELDDCGLPIRNLSADLWRLNRRLSAATQVKLTVIDYLSDYLAHGDLERNIARLGSALRALQAFAVEHGTAVLLPMQLPCRRQTDFTAAVQILAKSTEIKSVLIVERDMASETGTLRKLQGQGDQHACEHRFHVRQKWGSSEAKVRVIEWDSLAAFQDELSRRW
jgi:hypothetical protein